MKLIHTHIVLVEEGDTLETIVSWIYRNTDMIQYHFVKDDWVHTLRPGNLITFNDPDPTNANYKLNVNMLTISEGEQVDDKTV